MVFVVYVILIRSLIGEAKAARQHDPLAQQE